MDAREFVDYVKRELEKAGYKVVLGFDGRNIGKKYGLCGRLTLSMDMTISLVVYSITCTIRAQTNPRSRKRTINLETGKDETTELPYDTIAIECTFDGEEFIIYSAGTDDYIELSRWY